MGARLRAGSRWTSAPRAGNPARRARDRVAAAVLALPVLLVGCESSERGGDPASGQMLYLARCQTCHGNRGEKPTDGRSGAIRDLTAADIARTLTQYQDPSDGAPWWTALKSGLTNAQIQDLVAYFPILQAGSSEG